MDGGRGAIGRDWGGGGLCGSSGGRMCGSRGGGIGEDNVGVGFP
jgi:hypothetical protein